MCRWQVEDRDVKVVHEVQVRHHLFFYQQAFAEAVGVAAAAIAQASVAGSQGGLSHIILRRYRGMRSDGGRPLAPVD